MAKATTTYTQSIGTPAAYKAYYQPLSTILNTALPRTADTGQVNWGTVVTEPAVVRDYEIFSLGGPLAATAPIYVRFDYKGTAAGNVAVTVGTTTDGAGNLGGLTVASLPLHTFSIGTLAGPLSAWAASDGQNYLTFCYALDPAAAGVDGVGVAVVERTRDADGTANAAGFHVWRWQASTTAATVYCGMWSRVYAAQSQTIAADWNLNNFVPDFYNTNNAFRGATSYAFPALTYAGISPGGASQALMFAYSADFPRGTAVTVTHYGQQMTFVPLADSVANASATMSAVGTPVTKTLSPLIRWD